jgi:DNA-binding CsgD family transcriptional regulator
MSGQWNFQDDFKRLLVALERNFKQCRTLVGVNGINAHNLPLISEVIGFVEEIFPSHVILLYGHDIRRIYISESVKSVLGYSAESILHMSDADMLSKIHPEDFEPIAKALEKVDASTLDYRFELNFRYNFCNSNKYVHLSYEPITIQYKGYFVTCVLMRDMTKEQPFKRVMLKIKRRIGKQFVQIDEIVTSGKEEHITHREREIVGLIHKGMRGTEIANMLSISESTVKNHRRNLFKKLNVRSSIELVSRLNERIL